VRQSESLPQHIASTFYARKGGDMDRGQAMSLRICDENIDNSVNSLISFIFTTTVPLILLILFIFLFFIYLFIYLFILNLVPALPRETQGTGNEPNHESSRAEFQYGVLR